MRRAVWIAVNIVFVLRLTFTSLTRWSGCINAPRSSWISSCLLDSVCSIRFASSCSYMICLNCSCDFTWLYIGLRWPSWRHEYPCRFRRGGIPKASNGNCCRRLVKVLRLILIINSRCIVRCLDPLSVWQQCSLNILVGSGPSGFLQDKPVLCRSI